MKCCLCIFVFTFSIIGCTHTRNCADRQIEAVFIGFSSSDIDTMVLRKYEVSTNFTKLVDTLVLVKGFNISTESKHDSTTIRVSEINGITGIKVGNDWQLYLPSQKRTVSISNISSDKKTIKCGGGMDKMGCNCDNNIFSFKQDNIDVKFPNADAMNRSAFIRF